MNISKLISRSIYDYLEDRKESIFELYVEPQYVLKAFENESDGLGFLKQLLTATHPKLRDVTDYYK